MASPSEVPIELEPPQERTSLLDSEDGDKGKSPDILNAIWNLTNYGIGAGILAMAYAFNKVGVILGLIILLIVAVSGFTAMLLLMWSGQIRKAHSYEALATASGGNILLYVVYFFVIVSCIGTLAAYNIIIGEGIVQVIDNHTSTPPDLWATESWVMFLSQLVFVMPLCFLSDINKLGFTSFISLMPMLYLMILQLYYFNTEPVSGDVEAFTGTGTNFFIALPIVIFSYDCENVCPPLYHDLEKRGGTLKHIITVVVTNIIICTIAYAWSGLFGYIQWGPNVDDNVMFNYPKGAATDVLILSIVCSLLLSIPIILWPCREAADKMLFPNRPYTYFRFVVENIVIVWMCYGLAVAVPSFVTILGVLGAFTSTAIDFVLPAIFFLRLAPTTSNEDKRHWLAWGLMIVGGALGVISSVVTVKDYAENPS